MSKESKQFKLGNNANPFGQAKRQSVAQLARHHTPRVIARLAQWMEQDDNPAASVRACEILLDRAFGKAVQPVADGSNHEALELDLTNVSQKDLERFEHAMVKLLSHTQQINDVGVDIIDTTAEEVPAGTKSH